ncbi:MAG: hypothetical protein ACREVL_00100, partial [Solimonas sp.]
MDRILRPEAGPRRVPSHLPGPARDRRWGLGLSVLLHGLLLAALLLPFTASRPPATASAAVPPPLFVRLESAVVQPAAPATM